MSPSVFSDDDGSSPQIDGTWFQIDYEYPGTFKFNKNREDLQRLEELNKKGRVDVSDSSESDDDVIIDTTEDRKFLDLLIKVKEKDPSIRNTDVKFFEADESGVKKKKGNKKMYLKDVHAKHLLEDGPDFLEEDNMSYDAKNEALRKAVRDVFEGGEEDDDEELLREKEDDLEEDDDEELKKKMNEYFDEDVEVDEGKKFLKDYLSKQMWKEKDEEKEYDYESSYRHEEHAGEIVMGQSRKVEGSVRKSDKSRKTQKKSKEERIKIVDIKCRQDLKRQKNVKKKEMKEKMKKVLSVAGFKKVEYFPLDDKDLDDDFDPDEYDTMMKSVFDDNYYRNVDSDLDSADEEEEEEESKRKRKKKTSLVQKVKEALMEDYYKLDYEDTIGDLKTRFKYAKVQPNSYQLDTSEILVLDDKELNQYVPLKKMAPYVEKDWEVNKHKVKEKKRKNMELWQNIGKGDDEKRSKKKRPNKSHVDEEEGEAETSKLSRKAKRRRRLAEKKLPPNRMAAYGKA